MIDTEPLVWNELQVGCHSKVCWTKDMAVARLKDCKTQGGQAAMAQEA